MTVGFAIDEVRMTVAGVTGAADQRNGRRPDGNDPWMKTPIRTAYGRDTCRS
jgi:hypothetical protein